MPALPTACPTAGCCPSGPPGGGALSLAASHWPVELLEGDLSPATSGRDCDCSPGLACKGNGECQEGRAPPGPALQPRGLFINQASAPSWARYQLSLSWHCRKMLISI